jgi:mRNA-degrading endonuclease RelE of RelBE toxin-antitoxin system
MLGAMSRLPDQLQGIPDEWRLRVGDWQVRFRCDHPTRTLEALRILPRGQEYR